MEYKKVLLSKITNRIVGKNSFVNFYLCEKNNEINIDPRPAMIVIPGGGYEYCSLREGEPIALRYASEGFNCFVLNYTCNSKYPIPHEELAALFEYIKTNAAKLNVLSNSISLVGFSAGGHLAASYGYLYKEFEKKFGLKKDTLKPFSIVLGYPVVCTLIDTQSHSKDIITGKDAALLKKLNISDNINKDYPPTYIWTTKVDQCVPYEHSLQMVEALKRNKIVHCFDLYKNGIHGGSLCNHSVYNKDFDFKSIKENKKWVENSSDFIFSLLSNL